MFDQVLTDSQSQRLLPPSNTTPIPSQLPSSPKSRRDVTGTRTPSKIFSPELLKGNKNWSYSWVLINPVFPTRACLVSLKMRCLRRLQLEIKRPSFARYIALKTAETGHGVAFLLQQEGNEHKSRNIQASPSTVAKLSYLWHSFHITFIPHPSAFLPPILPIFYPTTFTMAPEYLITPSFTFCIYLSKGQDIFVDIKTTIGLLIIT